MKKIILALAVCMALVGCEDPDAPREADKPTGKPSADAGPYTVQFSGADQSYTHSFNLPIKQEEGQVVYHIATPTSSEIEFVDTRLQVTGCPVGNVKHQIFWSQDASRPTVGEYLTTGTVFRTRAGLNGMFRHLVHGLGGCTSITLTTKLKIKPQTLRTCKETTEAATCQVVAYCRQAGNSYYTEVEVWKESRGLVLRKFMNVGDGTRSLKLMAAVNKAEFGSITTYSDNYGDAALRIDGANREAILTSATGSERLICE